MPIKTNHSVVQGQSNRNCPREMSIHIPDSAVVSSRSSRLVFIILNQTAVELWEHSRDAVHASCDCPRFFSVHGYSTMLDKQQRIAEDSVVEGFYADETDEKSQVFRSTQDFLNMKMCVEAPVDPLASWPPVDRPPGPGSSSRRPPPPRPPPPAGLQHCRRE